MQMTMALLSSSSPTPTLSPSSSTKLHSHKPYLLNLLSFSKQPTKSPKFSIRVSSDNGVGAVVTSSTVDVGPTTTAAVTPEEIAPETTTTSEEAPPPPSAPPAAAATTKLEDSEVSVGPTSAEVKKFKNPKWVNGTWDLQQFSKNGATDWDAVIDAEAKRRKWLEAYPESTSNDEPIVFDTSIIPWWAWIKRFHLPEAELLNGRAAMIGFFMSYFVDSLTGLGVVDQMGNFFCKTLLFVAVLGVLLVRKNEDVDNLKKLLEETTFYDKQWQATWQEDSSSTSKKN